MSIKLEDVTHIYMWGTPYEKTALSNINLEIKHGEIIGIIGHTGSGKSTLVQHLNGLLKPTSGMVTVDGVNLQGNKAEAKAAMRKVGMVFQYPEHQLFEETIFNDIAFGPRNLGLAEEEVQQRVRKAMAFVGLDFATYAERSPFHLSGGQMRRVAIAGVIALEPEYLVLDEPSAGLDPRGRDEIFRQIAALQHATGITVVLVSHNMEEVARMVQRVIVMNHGRIALDGSPREIFRDHKDKLHAAGVDVPQVTMLLTLLKARGLDVDTSAMTIDEAEETVYQAVKGVKSC